MTSKISQVAIIGLGYVGLPLAATFAEAGVSVLGLDAIQSKVDQVNSGSSYIEDVPSERLEPLVASGNIRATTVWDEVRQADAIIICLPTPLTDHREPDLSAVAGRLREPGRAPAARAPGGAREHDLSGHDPGRGRAGPRALRPARRPRLPPGLLARARGPRPDRLDHGHHPKVMGGLTPECTQRAMDLYGLACDTLVPVGSPEVAELTKLLENIFRSVNIALVNELAMLCDRMNIDVWDVIDAAATKPFGYMPFRPGPGLGGHCIPIDPFYLTWKAREFDLHTEFIELAGKVNSQMPEFCVAKVVRALNSRRRALNGSRVLVIGVAYKANVNDMRESPALRIVELLRADGGNVEYHDPFVPALPKLGLASIPLTPDSAREFDVVVIVTAHDGIDWEMVAESARLIVDLRNVIPSSDGKVWKL